ncbi:TatD family hydrolase [Berryella wangjianweii]|uniref:TatD family hydrolase n=1 Tax=Berryella wangjianweii TaxID=2734634 RepID=A0A6M8J1S3_9ACTN|nr:TatD family hydrolase [Berryella wangjianweii]QKF07504.1 TatD family hydrolase [Berryella wangjianweii]
MTGPSNLRLQRLWDAADLRHAGALAHAHANDASAPVNDGAGDGAKGRMHGEREDRRAQDARPREGNARESGTEAELLDDAHCHLDLIPNGLDIAARAQREGCAILSCTVRPSDYARVRDTFLPYPCVTVGLGLHPWWVAEETQRAGGLDALMDHFAAHAEKTRAIAEVGLDLRPAYAHHAQLQRRAFARIADMCAQMGGKVMSIHAVQSAGEALDQLERSGARESCACVLHWFSGSSPELTRAIKAGYLFSVGPRMLASKRGRAYAQAIPRDQVILETDAPWRKDEPHTFDELQEGLRKAQAGLRRG